MIARLIVAAAIVAVTAVALGPAVAPDLPAAPTVTDSTRVEVTIAGVHRTATARYDNNGRISALYFLPEE